MPDKNGRLVPISVPRTWCAVCKLFACTCEPASAPSNIGPHLACGTADCCRTC